jgi:hypothetical protein
MPIPGDNGKPKEERDAQNKRIIDVAETGACVRSELKIMPPPPKEKNIFGVM